MNSLQVAIQGIKGSNHYLVAMECFGKNIQLQEFSTFDDVVESVSQNKSDVGILALENSIAGSIIPNYALLDRFNLEIIGEHYLHIHHYLMALPNQKMQDITEVASHPMALLQCKDYLRNFKNFKLVEDLDTAEVAKRIATKNVKNIAAIAPKIAAEMYGLQILADNIQTIKNNTTRFVVVQSKSSPLNNSEFVTEKDKINKASLKFLLDHKRGSLATILNVMSDCKLNLTKIQSLPKIDTPWKYAFFVDVTFKEYKNYEKAVSIIKIMAEDFKILGEYSNKKDETRK